MILKNFCPYSVGDILVTTTATNPSTKYLNTTWELIPSDKYIRTGNTALQTGGSNSISIGKANLPNIKLKVDSHSHTQPAHTHGIRTWSGEGYGGSKVSSWAHKFETNIDYNACLSAGGENTGNSAPYTEALGNGTALTIQPSYITLKFWKRLT